MTKRKREKPDTTSNRSILAETKIARHVAAGEAAKARSLSFPARVEMNAKLRDDGVCETSFKAGDAGRYLLYEALPSESVAFTEAKLIELMNLSSQEANGTALSEALAFVAALQPRDEAEAALAVQIYGAQRMAVDMMVRTSRATMLPQMQAFGNLANKFARTSSTLLETLHKVRRGGEQVVRHVHVYEGGQAIVADQVNSYRGSENEKLGGQGHALSATMLGAHPCRHPLPVASGQGSEAVPDARGEVAGGAEGQPERP